jgi:hypothetical protein
MINTLEINKLASSYVKDLLGSLQLQIIELTAERNIALAEAKQLRHELSQITRDESL